MTRLKRTYLLLSTFILLGLLALVIITRRYDRTYHNTASWVRHTIVVLNEAQGSLFNLHALEMGKPGGDIADHIRLLQRLTVDNINQQHRLDSALRYAEIIGRASSPIPDEAVIDVAATDSLRSLLLRLQADEIHLLNDRENLNDFSSNQLIATIWILLITVFALLLISSFLILYHLDRRKQAEQELEHSEMRFLQVVDHVRDYAIYMVDPQGRIVSWNQGAEQIKGYSADEIIGKHISIFYTEDSILRNEPSENLKRAASQGRYECFGQRKRKDGSLFEADVIFSAIYDTKDRLLGFTKITRDITDRKKADDDMRSALEREKELNEMKSRFVTLASHEFKTPLSVILTSTSLIEKYAAPEMIDNRARHIQRIKSNVKNLRQILNDFLSLEKLEEGVVRSSPLLTDLPALAEEIILDMEESYKQGQHIEFRMTGLPRPVPVDSHLLRNILNNLLSNAIKYSPERSGVLFHLQFLEAAIAFDIEDQGIGIPAEERDHLFERFFRAHNTTGIPGTGLGLSIVRRYLDLMGGQIAVRGNHPQGTVVHVVIPG